MGYSKKQILGDTGYSGYFLKAEKLEACAADLPTDSNPSKRPRMPNKESSACEGNSDNLDLSKAQNWRRRKASVMALKEIHCTPSSSNNDPVFSGMWSTLMNECSSNQLATFIKSSKVCTDKVIPTVVSNKVQEFEKSEQNIIRSATLLYKGGILSKRKYKDMRKDQVSFMPGVPVPRALPYDRLLSYIKGINMGTVNDLEVCQG